MSESLFLIVGFACAGIGGELFVRGTVGLAQWARISPGIVGATVAAFATSSPELSVSISSSLAGSPEISLGDALGSNVINVALILALALVISSIRCPRDSLRRDFPVALATPVITACLIADGELSRGDGLVMLGVFFAWLAVVILEVRKQRSASRKGVETNRGWLAWVLCVLGLLLLVVAGDFIVTGAKSLARSFGLDEFVIGATIVAVGTSMPELATTLVAKLRGHDDVGLGTILGSNIFNGVFIVAIAAIIHPIVVGWREVAVVLIFGFIVVALPFPSRTNVIERKRGWILLVFYAGYLAAILGWHAA